MLYKVVPWIPFLTLPVSRQVDWHFDFVPPAQRQAGLCRRGPAQQLHDCPPRSSSSYYMYPVSHRMCQHER